MRYSTTFLKAKEMDKNRLAAARIRMRFLHEEVDRCLEDGSEIALFWASEALHEVCYLVLNASHEPTVQGDRVTDEDIERANNYPIDMLIDFQRGKAYAFCHEDKNPSLSHWVAKNRARCFVCNRTFRPIDVLMERDGVPFKTAVRRLLV